MPTCVGISILYSTSMSWIKTAHFCKQLYLESLKDSFLFLDFVISTEIQLSMARPKEPTECFGSITFSSSKPPLLILTKKKRRKCVMEEKGEKWHWQLRIYQVLLAQPVLIWEYTGLPHWIILRHTSQENGSSWCWEGLFHMAVVSYQYSENEEAFLYHQLTLLFAQN